MPKRARTSRRGSGGSKRSRRSVTYRKKSPFRKRKALSKKRAPLVECKKKEIPPAATPSQVNTSAATTNSGTVASIRDFTRIPDAWASMQRGFDQDQMVGQDLFLKWLHVKVRLNFGQLGMLNLKTRVRVRALHGWIMLPGCTTAGTNTDYLGEVKNVLGAEMDKILAGPDKTKIRILSDRIITRFPQAVIDSGGAVQMPKRSEDLHFKWSPMRKIRYSQVKTSGPANTYIPDPTVGLWIPFYVLWDQSSGEAPAAPITQFKPSDGVYFQTREEMYYTDS